MHESDADTCSGKCISTHDSGGATLEKVNVSLGPVELATGLAYTLISRGQKSECLIFAFFFQIEQGFSVLKKMCSSSDVNRTNVKPRMAQHLNKSMIVNKCS